MTVEAASDELVQEHQSLSPVLHTLRSAVEEAAEKNKRIELVTFANDHQTGKTNVYSQLLKPDYLETTTHLESTTQTLSGYYIDQGLTQLITELTGDPEGRQDLESALSEEPDDKQHRSHHDEYRWEWHTIQDNVTLGLEVAIDDHGEMGRRWYARGSKKGIKEKFASLLGKQSIQIHPTNQTKENKL